MHPLTAQENAMAQLTTKTTTFDDSDFATHLQRRFGIGACELGECLTEYRPSRPYEIVLGSECRPANSGELSVG
jgi:hypothetical protein